MNTVDMIITDLAVFTYRNGKLTLIELMPGATLDKVRNKTSTVFTEDLSELVNISPINSCEQSLRMDLLVFAHHFILLFRIISSVPDLKFLAIGTNFAHRKWFVLGSIFIRINCKTKFKCNENESGSAF